MNLRKQRQRRRTSITSLIDVIFLLLLFFMLSSSFSKFSEIEVSAASKSASISQKTEDIQTIRLVLLENSFVIENLESTNDGLTDAVLAAMHKESAQLIISVDQAVTTQRLISTIVQLKTIREISLIMENKV